MIYRNLELIALLLRSFNVNLWYTNLDQKDERKKKRINTYFPKLCWINKLIQIYSL